MGKLKYVSGSHVNCDAIHDYFKGQGANVGGDFNFDNPNNAYYVNPNGSVDFMLKDSYMFKFLSHYDLCEEFKVISNNSATI